MNTFYVTVSIPLLLVLVGFNHAHGLTTFGKSNNQGTQQPQPPVGQAKSCNSQTNCSHVKGTTCLKGLCLCGDNNPPTNGICKAPFKGPNHMCGKDEDCVDGADCVLTKDINKNKTTDISKLPEKICACQEGLFEAQGLCGGGSNIVVLSGIITTIIATLITTLN